ncbi:MAG: type II toxin-antitoxin system mRNA interferase toxin, RelE/StbE family [bacterium]
MIKLIYAPRFVRHFKHLPNELQEEALGKIALFKLDKNHIGLKVHKLHGPLAGLFSFSVNYKTRIVFEYISKNEIVLLSIGDHDIYN